MIAVRTDDLNDAPLLVRVRDARYFLHKAATAAAEARSMLLPLNTRTTVMPAIELAIDACELAHTLTVGLVEAQEAEIRGKAQ